MAAVRGETTAPVFGQVSRWATCGTRNQICASMEDHESHHGGSRARSSSISSTMLDRLKARDAEAWRRLVALFGPRVYQWCRQWGLQPSDAADTVQEVFESVAASLAEFHRSKPGDTFRGWLWTIARNKVRDYYRRRANRPEAFGGTDANQQFQQLCEPNPTETDEYEVADSRRLIARRALNLIRHDFDEKTWQAFWRMTVEAHSSAEIGEDLGMTKDAVRQAKCRVLRRLREELQGLL